MRLRDAKEIFKALQSDASRIVVKPHAYKDHPERGFSLLEVVRLVMGKGILKENHVANPADGSFVWHCRDSLGRKCELAIVFKTNASGQLIAVISAYRRV